MVRETTCGYVVVVAVDAERAGNCGAAMNLGVYMLTTLLAFVKHDIRRAMLPLANSTRFRNGARSLDSRCRSG